MPKHRASLMRRSSTAAIWETIHRSAGHPAERLLHHDWILLFGGETVKQFIAILFIGLLSGTYSSIFTAVPLLVAWEQGELPIVGKRRVTDSAETVEDPA